MQPIIQDVLNSLRTSTPLDQVNFVLGIIGVLLMIRQTLWAFPVGLAGVTVQGVLFQQQKYYADAKLQIFFFVALAYGWWHWKRAGGTGGKTLPVTRLSVGGLVAALALAGAGTAAWAKYLQTTDAIMPWRDAFIAAFSVAAQVLQARKNIENWPLWTVVNVTAVCAYWLGGLYCTSLLYALYLGLGIGGWWSWHKTLQKQKANA